MDSDAALRATRAWVERAVIGLNLCPFAKAVQAKGGVRYVCSDAADTDALLAALRSELQLLSDTPMEEVETTLLVHPRVLQDFLDYNDFLGEADALLQQMGLEGTLQIASFHPQYQFAGTRADDIENATNRSPYPTLHLLRESSIDQAVKSFPQAEQIFEQNIRTLERLGREGWDDLDVGPSHDETPPR